MSVVRKFVLALGSMVALILFVSVIGFVALDILEGKAADIVADSMRMQRLALEVDSKLQLARQAEIDLSCVSMTLAWMARVRSMPPSSPRRLGEADRNVAWLQDMERFRVDKRDLVNSAARLEEMHQTISQYSKCFRELVGWPLQRNRGTSL